MDRILDGTSIPGLKYIPHFVTTSYANELLYLIDSAPWSGVLKRRVQHYGYQYDYKARAITKESKIGPLPDWLSSLCKRLQSEASFSCVPNQVIVNEYLPGQGISAHTDCVSCFDDGIASLSLNSACVMDFTHSQEQKKIPVLLEPESLIILSQEARYIWRHSIAPRKKDSFDGITFLRARRVSLTFRNVILTE